jgi:hypothetical protein
MVKSATAGNLLADSIKKALDWAKEWTLGAAPHAAHTGKMSLSMAALARAHGVSLARERSQSYSCSSAFIRGR